MGKFIDYWTSKYSFAHFCNFNEIKAAFLLESTIGIKYRSVLIMNNEVINDKMIFVSIVCS